MMALSAMSTSGQVNSWIDPGSGNWDEPSNWSLGVLPNSSQSVMIANSGWKAVAINPSTPGNFPGSMTVSNLTIRGAWDTMNTLLLNYFGTAVPLTVLNGVTLADDGRILNFNSALVVQSGTITVTNSQIIQDGGFVRTTNSAMLLLNAVYQMTNGVFEGGGVSIGPSGSAQFNQYGGDVVIASLSFGPAAGAYSLYGGTLALPGGMNLFGYPGGTSYFQSGGTNRTPYMDMEALGSDPGFTLNGGLLAVGDVILRGARFGRAIAVQNGGTHSITNVLSVFGGAQNPDNVKPAEYHLNGGTLSASVIELDANQGDSVFAQSNGTTFGQTFLAHSVGFFGSFVVRITLSGGSLSCSSFTLDDGRGSFNQSGGALGVSNLLTITGYRDLLTRVYGRYTFTGGTVTASNINIAADWIIGDGSFNRISNPGFIRLSHLLQISNAVEQLGRFVLASNATIDLAGSASRLSFANSSGETWTGGATLAVSNWNGNPSGGGAEQLRFGTSQSALTPAQLSQIRFRIGSELYTANILSTGEVVPDQLTTPSLTFSTQGNNLVLTWSSGWSLQSATNALGPYSDVPEATSPYTIDTTLEPQRFFRLRQ
jgi:hypothetical protein